MPAEGGERQPPERIAYGNHDAAGTQQLWPAASCAQPSISVSQGAGEPLAALLQLALRSSLSSPTAQDSYCSNAGMPATASSSSLPSVSHSSAIGSSDQALTSRFDALSLASTDFSNYNCLSSSAFGNSLADLESLQALDSLAQLCGQLPCQNQAQGATPTSSILTPADTSLLTALLALQQRQYWQSLSNLNGDLLLASLSGGGLGHGRSHSTSSSPSSLYKTELCRSWQETGSCRYGNKCQFAHGPNELRPIQRHPKYKTEICRTFATTGTCPYGTRCRFIHYFQRPPASTAASLSSLLAQAGIHPSSSPTGGLSYNLQHAGSGSSLDSYLTSYGAGASLLGPSDSLDTASLSSYLNAQAASGGVYMPPLPPASASQASSSGLPSLTGPSYAAMQNGIGGSSGLTEQQRRLPVFKTFTDVPSSLPM